MFTAINTIIIIVEIIVKIITNIIIVITIIIAIYIVNITTIPESYTTPYVTTLIADYCLNI